MAKSIQPEEYMDLQIRLDQLARAEKRCRQGLCRLAAGDLSTGEYMELLRLQEDAHRSWSERHHKYFTPNLSGTNVEPFLAPAVENRNEADC